MRRPWVGLVVVLALAWGGLAALLLTGTTPRLGLDLQGGISVVLTAPDGTEEEALDVASGIIRRRVEEIGGVQEPEIAVSGGNTLLVQLPGVKDEQRALDAVGQTGLLTFRPVLGFAAGTTGPFADGGTGPTDHQPASAFNRCGDPAAATSTTGGSSTTSTPSSSPTTTTPASATTTVSSSSTSGAPASSTTTPASVSTTVSSSSTSGAPASSTTVPATTTTTAGPPAPKPAGLDPATGLTVEDVPARETYLAFQGGVFHLGPAVMNGNQVDQALAEFNGGWLVGLDFDSEGADRFACLTGEAARYFDASRQIAIVLDGEIIAAPPVAQDVQPGVGIAGGSAVITMGSDAAAEQESRDLAVVLRYGSFPVSFEVSDVEKVSGTLGADSLRIGLISGLVGLGLVAIFLVGFYRSLGLVAIVGLTVFGSLLISIFSLLGAGQGLTLTLAGVTGIIVSVGITADSYVVYFERIKDEIRDGATVETAVTDGFKRAFRTIITADTVSLLAAGLLWALAVGPVKGFALALGIATILDIVVARTFTRRATLLLARTRLGDGGSWSITGAAGAGETPA